MEMRKNYLINTETSALVSYFDNYGNEYSRVLEGKETFLVSKSPDQIVKESYIYLGFTLDSAIHGTRSILPGTYMLPVVLSAPMGIILIRCNSTRKKGTTWLINSHIEELQPLKNGKTIVHTTYGHSLTIIMKPKALQDKRNQASFLHITFLERYQMNKTMSVAFEKNSGISLVMEDGNLNYTVEENRRKFG